MAGVSMRPKRSIFQIWESHAAPFDVFDAHGGMQDGKMYQLKGRWWGMRGNLIRPLRAVGINLELKAGSSANHKL